MPALVVGALAAAVVALSASVTVLDFRQPQETIVYVRAPEARQVPAPQQATTTVQVLEPAQETWLKALEWCESQANPGAVNPKDTDGTPSYGLLQFKPETFYAFGARYGLATSSGYKDPGEQEAIVTQMIARRDVDFSQQFPGCVRKLGLPPTD